MKVLIAAPYIYIENHKHGSRNKSGLAYMIRDISDMLAEQGATVYALTQSVFTSKLKVGKLIMLPKRFIHLLRGIRKPYIKYAYQIIRAEKHSFSRQLRTILYFFTGGYLETLIKIIKPDVVHIHSIGLYTLPFIIACVETNTKFIVTLHGLISFSDVIKATRFEKVLEKEYLNLAMTAGIDTTIISSGIRQRIEEWQKCNADYITVILNFVKSDFTHSIPNSKKNNKLILCVGSLSAGRNQIQLIRAFELLKSKREDGYRLLLIGDGNQRKTIENYIRLHSIGEVELIGEIPRDEVMKFYKNASLVVLPSIDEGFGLPVIEGYSYGVPAVAFSDLDAIPNVFNEDTMVLVGDRTDKALAEGIDKALSKEWDTNTIINFSRKFSPDSIGRQYYQVLSNVKNNSVTMANIDLMITKSIGNTK